jgi:hypothetical protein
LVSFNWTYNSFPPAINRLPMLSNTMEIRVLGFCPRCELQMHLTTSMKTSSSSEDTLLVLWVFVGYVTRVPFKPRVGGGDHGSLDGHAWRSLLCFHLNSALISSSAPQHRKDSSKVFFKIEIFQGESLPL